VTGVAVVGTFLAAVAAISIPPSYTAKVEIVVDLARKDTRMVAIGPEGVGHRYSDRNATSQGLPRRVQESLTAPPEFRVGSV
jgi:uncharacterized protein involved in exopolysaccharide biosynthesis